MQANSNHYVSENSSRDAGPPFVGTVRLVAGELVGLLFNIIIFCVCLFGVGFVFLPFLSQLIVILTRGRITDGMDFASVSALLVAWLLTMGYYGSTIGALSKSKADQKQRMVVQTALWTLVLYSLWRIVWPTEFSAYLYVGMIVVAPLPLWFGIRVGERKASQPPKESRASRWLLHVVGIAIIGGVCFWGSFTLVLPHLAEMAEEARHVGKRIPNAQYFTLDNQPRSLDEYRGSVILLDHRANGSRYGRDLQTQPQHWQASFGDHDDFMIVVMTGDTNSNPTTSAPQIENGARTWQVWHTASDAVQVLDPLFPCFYVVDRSGTVTMVRETVGFGYAKNNQDIRAELQRLLDE